MASHSTHREGYQSKLLAAHSKGCRCNFWGLLHYDDRTSPRWASCNGPQHDCSRSDTVMPLRKLGYIFHYSCFVLFCFCTRDYIYYTSVHYRENLQNSEGLFRFLFQDFRLCWPQLRPLTFSQPLSGSSVATCWLAFSEISLSINEKKSERSPGNSDLVQMTDSFSSARCFVLWQSTLFQPRTARVICELHNNNRIRCAQIQQ